jgi:endonuclease/exonuclease/phosphatase family metal-dependent hydrolase
MPRAVLELGGGRAVRLVDVHPYPPKRNLVGLWRDQFATLPEAEPGAPVPWVLAGDFNATLDFPQLRDLVDSGYRDAGDVTGDGLEPTWPSDRLLPPPVTIDHVLADRRVAVLDYEVEDLDGTDHRAVFARLAIR